MHRVPRHVAAAVLFAAGIVSHLAAEDRAADVAVLAASEHAGAVAVVGGIVTMPEDAVAPEVRGEVIRLWGYLRPTGADVIGYLCGHADFIASRRRGLMAKGETLERLRPVAYALAETDLPAVPALLRSLREPLPPGTNFFATTHVYFSSALTYILSYQSGALLRWEIDKTMEPEAQRALAAGLEQSPTRPLLTYQQLVPRTFDLPETYKVYPDPDELRKAILSEDDAVRHAALSGVLRTYKEHAKALTDLVAAEGPADAEVLEAIGQLRPRQEEAVQALMAELTETVTQDPMDKGHEQAVVTALARIGCPGVRACVELLKTTNDKRVEKGCVDVLCLALGQFGDDWLLAEAQYGQGKDKYADRLTGVAEHWKPLFRGGGIWELS